MTETVTQPADNPWPSAIPAGSSAGPDCTQERRGTPRNAPAERVDRLVHAVLARATGGVSPVALELAWLDWAWHLACSPGKQVALAQRISQQSQVGFTGLSPRLSEDSDPRFNDPDWNLWPFNLTRTLICPPLAAFSLYLALGSKRLVTDSAILCKAARVSISVSIVISEGSFHAA
jgi:polyhydroxyalkanoate synthase